MTSQVSPLPHNVPIVDPNTGFPKPEFTTNIQQLLDEKATTDGLAEGAAPKGSVGDSGLTMATSRLLGRVTADTGAIEELTLTQALDLIGSAAWGDILYRGENGWARLPAGTSGQFLKTLGAGENPEWAAAAAGAFTGARIKRTTNQTGANYSGSGALVPFEAADFDTDSFFSAGTPTRLTVPVAYNGRYANAQGGVQMSDMTADNFARLFLVLRDSSGTAKYAAGAVTEFTNTTYYVGASLIGMLLATGDYLEMSLTAESDSSITIPANAFTGMAIQII